MRKQILSVSEKYSVSIAGPSNSGPRLIPPDPATKRIKVEEEPFEEVHWSNNSRGRYSHRGRGRGRGGRGSGRRGTSRNGYSRNSIDPATGTPYTCFICKGTDHFARDCTEEREEHSEQAAQEDALMVITLYTNEGSEQYEVFIAETECGAVLDSGCTNTC